jgi:hypothetical protein
MAPAMEMAGSLARVAAKARRHAFSEDTWPVVSIGGSTKSLQFTIICKWSKLTIDFSSPIIYVSLWTAIRTSPQLP